MILHQKNYGNNLLSLSKNSCTSTNCRGLDERRDFIFRDHPRLGGRISTFICRSNLSRRFCGRCGSLGNEAFRCGCEIEPDVVVSDQWKDPLSNWSTSLDRKPGTIRHGLRSVLECNYRLPFGKKR